MYSQAEIEQRKLESEIDTITAQLIREQGIPLYEAVEIAKRSVKFKRTGCPDYSYGKKTGPYRLSCSG